MRRDRGRACSQGWVGLIDILFWSLLLLDFQDCRLPDLLSSPKQSMEAPLQTGMVRVGDFLHRTTTPGGLAVHHAILSPRIVYVQAKLHFPACIAGDLVSGKACLVAPPVGGGKETGIDPFCRWGHRVTS